MCRFMLGNALLAALVLGSTTSMVEARPYFGGHGYSGGRAFGFVGRGVRGSCGGYSRSFYGHRYYGYPQGCRSFGFGFGAVWAPAPVYVAPPPVVYYQAPPVVVPSPSVSVPSAEAVQASPTFVETNRRFHEHGSNEGRIDWVEGLLDGRPVRIYYDDFGNVKKQKWID